MGAVENWFVARLAETSLGGYSLIVVCLWYLAKNIFGFIKAWQDERKLTLEEKQANREGFTDIVEGLRNENRLLLQDQKTLREEYALHRRQCQEENEALRRSWHTESEQLRSQLVVVEDRLAGVFRKVADIAIRVTRGNVDADVVTSILELAVEAQQISGNRDGT